MKRFDTMNHFFSPYIGRKYYLTRTLILGESHYCNQKCSNCGVLQAHSECYNFTERVIKYYIDRKHEHEGWMNTYLKFERSLVGYETQPNERGEIWDNVAFYNYLQVAMERPRQAGTMEQYQQAESALFKILEQLRPKLMIVWGKQLWRNLPNKYWTDSNAISIQWNSSYYEHEEVGFYSLPSNHIVHALCVYHPSAGYDWSYWYSVIGAMKRLINL